MNMRKMMLSALTMALVLSLGCGKKEEKPDVQPKETTTTTTTTTPAPKAEPTIAEVVAKDPRLKTLAKAINAAELSGALAGAGPFTLFAPTDKAFNDLGQEKINELLQPVNKPKLAGILKFHVVPAKVMAADVKTMGAKTLQGGNASVVVEGTTVTYAGAKVITTDIKAGNGVIHLIDKVVMPPM